MVFQKGVKFRIYPNREQRNLIDRTLGCSRLIYNKGLAMREDAFKSGEKCGYKQTSAMLTALKQDVNYAFLKEVDSIALQQALRNLDTGYTNFFEHRAAHPKFKSKKSSKQSYRTLNIGNGIRISNKRIRLPKIGWVKVHQSMEIGAIHNATVVRTITGKYFVVLNVEYDPQPMPNNGCVVGIDVGLKEFYSDSNGTVVNNPKYLEKKAKKLAREQRRLAHKQKGSHNREKQRIRVAATHEKIANQRKDFLQKQSTMLVRENQTICIEDLNVKGMLRNHKLARAISSVSWSSFFSMLEYKAYWYGCTVIRVPTFYPSSQTCSCCGYKNVAVKNLSIRQWECPTCAKASKGERKVKAVLDELGVTYKQQESFEDLKDKHPLRFDFTIYQNDKLIAVIEFNGIQHYKPRSVFGGEKAFQMQKKHDLMKVQYCVDHGLYLLQIPYKTCECDTEEYVKRLFKNLGTYQKIMENQARWQRPGILHQKTCTG